MKSAFPGGESLENSRGIVYPTSSFPLLFPGVSVKNPITQQKRE
jgi:hypothetical protein